jgi:hypothetical protein
MRRFIPRRWPSPGLVVAIVALVAASGGTALAAGLAGSGVVANDDLKRSAVTRPKIRNGAVNSSRLSPGVRALLRQGLSFPVPGTLPPSAGGTPTAPPVAPGTSAGWKHFASLLPPNSSQVTILTAGGSITLQHACSGDSGDDDLRAQTTVNDSIINSNAMDGNDGGTNSENIDDDVTDNDYDTTESKDLLADDDNGVVGQTDYAQPGGVTVSIRWQAEEDPFNGDGCLVSGTV